MIRLAVAILLSVGSVTAVSAQSNSAVAQWPDRPIRFIVPFPAGAATDVAARIVAQRLGDHLGQMLVVENRVGASGNIGSDAVAKAAPDGYTIGFATATTHPIAASLSPNLSYDPIKDFTPVSMLGSTPYALVAWNGLPVKTVADLIAYAKANPGKVAYSSVGPASLAYLAAQLFSTTTGVEFTHVPYRSASQAVFDLMEGRIQIQFGLVGASLSAVRDGKLKALAVTSLERVPDLPGVPTVAESGLPGYEATLWTAVVMPPNVSPVIVTKLHQAIVDTLKDPEIMTALESKGFIVESSTPEQLRARIEQDIHKWRDLAVKAKITVQ
jgi:tripartite-type tricarboxylate transporter receptor subunit TctC